MPKSQNHEQKQQRPAPAKPPVAPEPVPAGPPRSALGCIVQWFVSHTVRQATAMRRHVEKLLNHQRDILSVQAVQAIQTAIVELKTTMASTSDKAALERQMENLEAVAN